IWSRWTVFPRFLNSSFITFPKFTIFSGMFFSRATVSSSWRTVVLPTPGMPATMMVRDTFLAHCPRNPLTPGYVAVEDLSYRSAGASESLYLHSRVDQLFCDCLRIHSAHLHPCDREEDAGEYEDAHVYCRSNGILKNDGNGSR